MVQIILMTSDGKENILTGWFHQFQKYVDDQDMFEIVVCGYSEMEFYHFGVDYTFFSIGEFKNYPANQWSNALKKVLDEVANSHFILSLDDYWIPRRVDIVGINMINDYMPVYQNVLKFDVTDERLYSDGGNKYLWGNNGYNVLGHLDMIKSNFKSAYQMSLWIGFWNKHNLLKVMIPNETPQQIELNGTTRLQAMNDEIIVLGTRQSPMKILNVVQGGKWNQDQNVGLKALNEGDYSKLVEIGAIIDNPGR